MMWRGDRSQMGGRVRGLLYSIIKSILKIYSIKGSSIRSSLQTDYQEIKSSREADHMVWRGDRRVNYQEIEV
ncbi:hypothetical protein CBR_g45425 [Chara braunii]|uniref:Uncharacterized protein n=1 Tax=Chara braunii TaxID=69332 RepID=A0A388LYL9_CHABU|nr:hypothetical protein CBR_g45425 [Chara braunii]|eukprot:GBG87365.1 hypothetical protein CBR_g45425 [Chara braunii]